MSSNNRKDIDETGTCHGDAKAGRSFTLDNDDDSKLMKVHNEWKRVRSSIATNLDSEKIKTVALIVLVAFILVRLGNSTGAPPPNPMVHGKALRRSEGSDLDHEYHNPNLIRHPLRGSDSISSKDFEAAPSNMLLMTASHKLENNILAGSLHQQSQATQRSFLHAQHQRILQEEHQRQQQAMLLAQQQQQALLHAKAQRQLEEQLAIQQQTFLEQQKALLRKQQQEQQDAILLQQQQLRGQDTLILQKLLQKRNQESESSDSTAQQLGVFDALPIPLSDSSVGNSKPLSADTTELDQKTQSTPSSADTTELDQKAQSTPSSADTTELDQKAQSTPSEEEASGQSGNDNSSAMNFANSSIPIEETTSPPQNSEQALETEAPVDVSEKPIPGLTFFRDSWHPYNTKDIPMYFHIPKAGGSTIKDVIGSCLRMVVASEFGVTDGHDKDTEIAIVYPKVPGGTGTEDRSPFVNVDATTVAGIQRASRMKFADSGLAGLVVSPFLYEANELFTESAQGRLFAVFRHPVDRAVSMFYYIQVASWEPSYMPELKSWTLEQYAKSSVIENNWITRQLSNVTSGDLNDNHLKAAMDVIRRKFLVGIMSKIDESMTRFEKFFRWKYHVNPTNQEACRERLLGKGSNSNEKNKKEKPKPGEPLWELLAAQNLYDIQLYQYVETLFVEQEAFVTGISDDFRKIDATCCKCDPPTYPLEGFSCPKKVLN